MYTMTLSWTNRWGDALVGLSVTDEWARLVHLPSFLDRFCRVPELRLSQSGPYLCSKRAPAWFPAHLFQVQHIEAISLRKMEPLRKPDIKFTQVTFLLLFNSYHGKYRQFFWVHINHIIPSISCESVSIFFSLVSFISKRNHRSSSTMNGWTRCLEKAFQQWIPPQVRFSICQMLIKLSSDRQT